jgi:hypothetical protein
MTLHIATTCNQDGVVELELGVMLRQEGAELAWPVACFLGEDKPRVLVIY